MDSSGMSRRGQQPVRAYKANRTSVTDQQKRRDLALARQKAARWDCQAHARRLVMGSTWQDRTGQEGGAVSSQPEANSQAGTLGSARDSVPQIQEVDGEYLQDATNGEETLFYETPPEETTTSTFSQDNSTSTSTSPGDTSTPSHEDGYRGASSISGRQREEASRKQPAEGGGSSGGPSESLEIAELDSRTGTWVRIGRDGLPVTVNATGTDSKATSLASQSQDSSMDTNGDCDGRAMSASDSGGSPVVAMPSSPGGAAEVGREGSQEWYSQQLMTPEWMVDIPPRLQTDWFVLARPEGRRCLVISSNGMTISRLRNGRALHTFPSMLPNGARVKNVAAASDVYCILDCVFHEANSTYYVVDVMAWKGYTLYDCTAEFRFFWLQSKLPETLGLLNTPPSHFHRFRFALLPVLPCTEDGLRTAYQGLVPFQRDGLLFYNRHGHYTLGLTPLVLAWKDSGCSQYLVDTDAKGNIPTQQQIVLEYRADGTVATSDTPPVVLGSLPPAFCQNNSKHLAPGFLLKFSIGPGGLTVADGKVTSADIRYGGPANQRRGGADSFSKIMFQYAARKDPLAFEHIVEAMVASEGSPDENAMESGNETTSFGDMDTSLPGF